MQAKRIAVLISGSGTNLQALIDQVDQGSINGRICLVISNREKAYGLERAKKHHIRTEYIRISDFDSDLDFDRKILEYLREEKIDLIVLAGYLRFLSHVITSEYKDKIINIHPSLLPSFGGDGYYGLKVHEACLARGCKVSGATVHFVDESMDTGPIILQDTVPVYFEDTAEDLQKRVLKIEHTLLPQAVRLFCMDQLQVVGNRVKIKEL